MVTLLTRHFRPRHKESHDGEDHATEDGRTGTIAVVVIRTCVT